LVTYKLAYDTDISNELRRRFASQIAILENEGFRYSSLHQEIIHPFSVLIYFPIYMIMRLSNEIMKIESPLRISSFHLMFTSPHHATHAYVYGLGSKFYTSFSDGTWLVSNTQLEARDESVIVIKRDPEITSTDILWKRHQEKISELLAQGKHLHPQISFDAWASFDQRFDRSGMLTMIRIGAVWMVTVVGVLYCLISTFIMLASLS
jgi:hypothetical protein